MIFFPLFICLVLIFTFMKYNKVEIEQKSDKNESKWPGTGHCKLSFYSALIMLPSSTFLPKQICVCSNKHQLRKFWID